MNNSIIFQNEQYYITVTKGTIRNLYPTSLKKGSLHDLIRWALQLPQGYIVFSLYDHERIREIAYCFIAFGGNIRYPFAKKDNIIIGPYYVDREFRKRGYSKLLINSILSANEFSDKLAYAFVHHDNNSSIAVLEKTGFKYLCDCRFSKYLRRLDLCETNEIGDVKLYKRE